MQGLAPIWHYFGSAVGPDSDRVGRILDVLPEGRLHVALDGDAIVGCAGAFQFGLTVPGGTVQAAGVTVVGVLPSHRRRGILRELMRVQLDDIHQRGEPLAVLWASEGGIYGRFGYGLAALCGDMDLERAHAGFSAPVDWPGTKRVIDREEALKLFPQVYNRVRGRTPGMFVRTNEWWTSRVFDDPEWRRAGGGELSFAVLERDGVPEAYALYRLNIAFEAAGLPTGATVVVEAMGATDDAEVAVWRYLLDVDWMARIQASSLPVDHPLLLLLTEPGRMRFRISDGIWVRLVDVGTALAARSFAGEDDLVLEVADTFCAWNDARFRLDGTKTTEEPDLRLSAGALGSLYLGGFSVDELARVGRVEEVTDGAVARAQALFRTDRAPWCPEIF